MKVFFFEPFTLAIPHYETALELIQNHLNKGDEVNFFYCNAGLNFCEANYTHSLQTCLKCISRRKNGLELIEGREKIKISDFVNLSGDEKKLINNWNISFKDINELKAYQYENIDMGMAIASSLISIHRDPEPDVTKEAYMINRMFKAALKVYFSFKRLLQNNTPDLFYIFNGRFSDIRPVVRLCEINRINYKIHERGANKNKYALYENHLPHNFEAFQQLVNNNWNNASGSNDRYQVAEAFYQARKSGKEQSWHSFVTNQEEDKLPSTWNSGHRNIVIFNSSEDEFAAIGDYFQKKVFKTQLEGIRFIASALKEKNDISVYVRVHPNLTGINNATVRDIYKIKAANFHIIEPTSSISSYKLIDMCDAVVTFGSTVGVESTFWGKPSILLGDSFYKDLKATYNPQDTDSLRELLLTVNKPMDKLGAYQYGYYLNGFGIDFELYQAEGLFEGKFKGVRINPSPWINKYSNLKIVKPIMEYISRVHAEKH